MIAFAIALQLPTRAGAAEPYRAFLRGLHERGYGEAAADYVEQLRSRPDLPEDIRQILDLEQAKSLRISATETVNADEAAQRLASAATYLQKFLKEHSSNPETPGAYFAFGEIATSRAQRALEVAQGRSDLVEREARITEGRNLLDEARKQFAAAADGYDKQLKALLATPDAPETKTANRAPSAKSQRDKQRVELEESWAESQFKVASTDLAWGRTYSNPKQPERLAAFRRAAAGFDAVYQRFRFYRLGIYAHLWQAKVAIELGDLPLASDVLDEVLANAPEKGAKMDMAIEPILSEAEWCRLQILGGQGEHETIVAEAQDWLKFYPTYRATAGAQGVALQLSRSELALASKLDKEARQRAMRGALVRLAELARIPGPHQREAILLRRQYASESDNAFDSFAEAVAVAEASASDNNWALAAAAYEKAIDLGRRTQSAKELNATRLSMARALSAAGRHEDAIALAEKLAREQPEPDAAPQAGALAVNLALNAFVSAKDKGRAKQRLFTLADFMTQRWPARSETDDARLALGKLELAENHLPQAAKIFETMNPASERYPLALHFAAQAHWMQYLTEQKKPAEKRNATEAADQRKKAVDQLTKSLELQTRANRNGTPSRAMIETMLLLAETHLEAGQYAEAAPLLAPAMTAVRGERGKALDNVGLRIAVASTKTSLGLKQPAEAINAATILADRGEDVPVVGSFLVAVLQQVRTMMKAGDPAEAMEHLAASIASRKQIQPSARLVVAEECARAGRRDLARSQYELLLQHAEKDAAWKQQNAKLVAHARSRIIELLRDDERFAEALDQAERLQRDNPQKLDPLVAKGRVLEQWAKVDSERLDAAIEQWTDVRVKLQRMQQTVPEYYEAVYGAASCLMQRAVSERDDESRKAAEQLLQSTLVLHPALDGPKNVARYHELLERIHAKR
jgi:hypothetical protein